MQGNTIAFSTETNTWTTRYSFVPSCYATLNDHMYSFPEKGSSTTELGWEHDSNETRNLFYGVPYALSLSVVANTNPSQNKTFQALSIESDSNKWSASLYTNDTPVGASERKEFQSTFITASSLQRRGSVSYSNIPGSTVLSESNVSQVGVLNGFANGILSSGTVGTFNVNIDRLSDEATTLSSNSFLVFVDETGTLKVPVVNNATSFSAISYGDLDVSSQPLFYIDKIDTYTNTVKINYSPNFNSNNFSAIISQIEGSYCFVSNPGTLTGDPMRGHYMRLDLTIDAGTSEPIELFAINTQFVDSPLNATLA